MIALGGCDVQDLHPVDAEVLGRRVQHLLPVALAHQVHLVQHDEIRLVQRPERLEQLAVGLFDPALGVKHDDQEVGRGCGIKGIGPLGLAGCADRVDAGCVDDVEQSA